MKKNHISANNNLNENKKRYNIPPMFILLHTNFYNMEKNENS